jgi:Bacterial lectin
MNLLSLVLLVCMAIFHFHSKFVRADEPELEPNEIDFSDGFDCASAGIQLNGNRPFPVMVPNGVNTKCTLQFTSDKAEQRAVSAFSPLTFDSPLLWFQSRFRYSIYGSAAGRADGIAFVVHQDVRGLGALGGSGGNIGVYGSSSTIIKPALVVELDTCKYQNGNHARRTKFTHQYFHIIVKQS